ncbi:MAG TPA: response regulator transcription factor [Verrucomicrobiae bacterium]|nr:response regulator transcription factor [Verrucomicrobiae bacterium]
MMSLDNTARFMALNGNSRSQGSGTVERKRTRILLADSNASFLEFAREELSVHPDLEVVGWVRTGKEALALTRQLSPDVVFLDLFAVLLDLFVPGQNAMETIVRLKALPNPPKIIILSHRESPEYRPGAFAAGADEFLTKPEFKQLAQPLIRKLMSPV